MGFLLLSFWVLLWWQMLLELLRHRLLLHLQLHQHHFTTDHQFTTVLVMDHHLMVAALKAFSHFYCLARMAAMAQGLTLSSPSCCLVVAYVERVGKVDLVVSLCCSPYFSARIARILMIVKPNTHNTLCGDKPHYKKCCVCS